MQELGKVPDFLNLIDSLTIEDLVDQGRKSELQLERVPLELAGVKYGVPIPLDIVQEKEKILLLVSLMNELSKESPWEEIRDSMEKGE